MRKMSEKDEYNNSNVLVEAIKNVASGVKGIVSKYFRGYISSEDGVFTGVVNGVLATYYFFSSKPAETAMIVPILFIPILTPYFTSLYFDIKNDSQNPGYP